MDQRRKQGSFRARYHLTHSRLDRSDIAQ